MKVRGLWGYVLMDHTWVVARSFFRLKRVCFSYKKDTSLMGTETEHIKKRYRTNVKEYPSEYHEVELFNFCYFEFSSYLWNVSDMASNMPQRLHPHTNLQESALPFSTPTTLSVELNKTKLKQKLAILAEMLICRQPWQCVFLSAAS